MPLTELEEYAIRLYAAWEANRMSFSGDDKLHRMDQAIHDADVFLSKVKRFESDRRFKFLTSTDEEVDAAYFVVPETTESAFDPSIREYSIPVKHGEELQATLARGREKHEAELRTEFGLETKNESGAV